MLAALVLFAQLNVSVAAPDTVLACEAFTVNIVASGRGVAAPVLVAPDVAPLGIVSSRASSQTTSDVLGSRWTVTEIQLTLLVDRPGRYDLGPFEVRSGRTRVRTRRQSVTVVGMTDSVANPSVVARARVDTGSGIELHAVAVPETVYVGEQATYQVGVFVSPDVREKLRRNPSFVPPALNALMAYDRAGSRTPTARRRVGAQCYDVLVYERPIFPLSAGRHEIPPAELIYALSVGAGFFAGEERRQAASNAVAIVALDPPVAGRPADYAGAVGDLDVAASVDTQGLRVGDPLVLTMRVEGEGNVKLLPRPRVVVPWATLVAGAERVRIDSAARRVRGRKEFDWILTPRLSGTQTLAPIVYPVWNPRTLEYEIATTDAETLTVAPGALVALDTGRAPARPLALRRTLRAPVRDPLPRSPLYLLALAAAPVPALGALAARRRRRRAALVPAAVRLRALRRRGRGVPLGEVRRTFAAALAERGVVRRADLTRPDMTLRALRRAGVSAETAQRVAALMMELDEASYSTANSRHGALANDGAARAITLLRAVDREGRDRGMLGGASVSALLLVAGLGMAGSASADPARPVTSLFADAVGDYDEGRYALATARFDSAARSSPRSADAWANTGTSAWLSHDTVTAVVGWQRALRLEPLARDVRSRLELTPAPATGTVGLVPPVPPDLLAALAIALWWAGWAGAALRIAGRSRPGARAIYALHGFASATGVAYVLVSEQLAAKSLRVVAERYMLRGEPSLISDPSAQIRAGEIVRETQREGQWTRVIGAVGTEGWIESDRLRLLSPP